MLSRIDLKRKKNEVIQAMAARSNLEFKIEEHLESIDRIREAISSQTKRISDLESEIAANEPGLNAMQKESK